MLNKIKEIAIARGNGKIRVMKKYPELKRVLEYAYNPFKKYHITAPDVNGTIDWRIPLYEVFVLLDKLVKREITGDIAKTDVLYMASSLRPDSAEIFKMILNKDLRCGINVKSINKAFPGLIPLTFDGSGKLPVMLLKNYDPKKIKYPCYAAVKKDGVRGMFKDGQILSRQGKPLVGLEHITEELDGYGIAFDGELCVPGKAFDVASGLIRSDKPTPEAVYYIFDIPSSGDIKVGRYRELTQKLGDYKNTKIIVHYEIENEEQLKRFYAWAISIGEEGIVIYDMDSLYEDKRSYDWMRMVPIKTADCPVIGFFEGKGKHKNSLGGIIVDYKGHEVRVGTGFAEKVKESEVKQLVNEDDKKLLTLNKKEVAPGKLGEISPIWQKIRQFIWDNQDQYLGVIAECEFKEETKAGSMRQPRFKSWRFDK